MQQSNTCFAKYHDTLENIISKYQKYHDIFYIFDIFHIFQKMKISNKLCNSGCNTLI